MSEPHEEVDWSIFDEHDVAEIHCKCGAIFHSHCKYVHKHTGHVTRQPCPGCGSHLNAGSTYSGPIHETISSGNIGKL